ncbi:hypothetical protein VOLCADRAFT_88725 [Volvox carteri f. nagariensis]|uniref:Uncharacterized protein n=1 Tax=Volvox carteri f. nagariensis TaxID=3068 RepID=D8TPS8_VOLCA|nr:uncharacterized protein VOLCADRAFT_88725 [Volvox carteri f. nagariensis]EFJ50409.1 hypothetical protein VOLCADRAFT_88725 [Volvox carteri f. nagariensis]|eukprot:XP_002948534.1 hypothetical protein VOLCADRAFT_88725 [Volvox carteri f. nagariensis]
MLFVSTKPLSSVKTITFPSSLYFFILSQRENPAATPGDQASENHGGPPSSPLHPIPLSPGLQLPSRPLDPEVVMSTASAQRSGLYCPLLSQSRSRTGASPSTAQAQPRPTHVYGRGPGGGGGGHWPPRPSTTGTSYELHATPRGYGHGGWEHQQQLYYQSLSPGPGAAYPGLSIRGGYGGGGGCRGGWHGSGGHSGLQPNKWVRTEAAAPAAPAPEGPVATAVAPVPVTPGVAGRGRPFAGRGDGGWGRGGSGGWGRGRGGSNDDNATPAAMQAYYKPSFGADPWAALTPRPMQPRMPGQVAEAGGSELGRDGYGEGGGGRSRGGGDDGGAVVGSEGMEDEGSTAVYSGFDGSGGADEPPEDDDNDEVGNGDGDREEGVEIGLEGQGTGVEEEGDGDAGSRLSEKGVQDRPWH